MKVLFLNPPDFNKIAEMTADEKSQEYLESDDFGAFPPLGIMYVMAYLEKHGPHHKLYFKDCVAERIGHIYLSDYVNEINPDIVAMTSFTVSMIDVVIAARSIRKILPNGDNLGIKISYAEQKYPKGLPHSFQIGKEFIG